MHWEIEVDGDTRRIVTARNRRKKRILPRIFYIPVDALWSRIILREG